MLIRWSRIIPRLILFFLLLTVVWLERDKLICWQIRSNIQRLTGAAAEIDSVQTDLQNGSAVINDLRLYDSKKSNREMIRVEKITVQGNRDDLLRRYYRLTEVNVEGIHIIVDETDGQFVPDKFWNKLKDRIPKEISVVGELDWSTFLTDDPKVAAKNLLQQLETSRLLDNLKQRWPNEVQNFEKTAMTLKQRLQNVNGLSENAKNSTDKLQLLEAVLKELGDADLSLQQLFNDVTKIKTSAQSDYQSLVDSAKRDQEKIKKIQPPKIDADQFSKVLIGPELQEQWQKAVTWGDWARSLLTPIDLQGEKVSISGHFGLTPPKRFHGETIALTTLDARSELLIDTANLTGQILFGSIPVYFNGTVKNIAGPATLGPAPMVAQFCFSGSGIPTSPILPDSDKGIAAEQVPAAINPDIVPNIYVTLSVDRIGENIEDQMIIRCPIYQLPERILGNPEKLAINVSPGKSKLDGVLILQDEKLSGEIRIVQSGVQLAVIVPEKQKNSEFVRILQQSLSAAGDVTATIFVSGTRTEPVYAFKSNISELLLPRLDMLVAQEWNSLLQEADQLVLADANQGAEILNSVFQGKIDPMVNDINSVRAQWEQKVAQASGVPLEQLVQSQYSKLSLKDQQRLGSFMQSPSVQALLQNGQTEQPQVDQLIQRGAEKLQDKIPGLLDKLKKK